MDNLSKEEKRRIYMREYAKKRRATDPIYLEKCREAGRKSAQKNKEKKLISTAKWKEKNKEKISEYNKEYALKNSKKILEKRKLNNEKTKDKRKIVRESWVEKNKENITEYNKIYFFDRYKNDPIYKLKMLQRNRIRVGLKTTKKSLNTCNLLGCTFDFLKKYIEKKFVNGMNWENMGKWHIDHIVPLAAFDLTKEENQKIAFHYTNLQPLWAIDNLKKGAKYA